MKPPEKFTRIVNRTRYSVQGSTLLAGNDWWDGHNFERGGCNTFLYRTRKGSYFVIDLTQWQGSQDELRPVDQDEAISLYENGLSEHRENYQDAFPGVEIQDA